MFTIISCIIFFIVFFSVYIYHLIQIAKDDNCQNKALWIILTVFFSNTGYGIKRIVDGEVMKGLFWIFAYPILISLLIGVGVLLDIILFGSL